MSLISTPSIQLDILYTLSFNTTTLISHLPYHHRLHLLLKTTTSPPNTLLPHHLTPIPLVLIFISTPIPMMTMMMVLLLLCISLTNTTTIHRHIIT
jgi:hypothetical protein